MSGNLVSYSPNPMFGVQPRLVYTVMSRTLLIEGVYFRVNCFFLPWWQWLFTINLNWFLFICLFNHHFQFPGGNLDTWNMNLIGVYSEFCRRNTNHIKSVMTVHKNSMWTPVGLWTTCFYKTPFFYANFAFCRGIDTKNFIKNAIHDNPFLKFFCAALGLLLGYALRLHL